MSDTIGQKDYSELGGMTRIGSLNKWVEQFSDTYEIDSGGRRLLFNKLMQVIRESRSLAHAAPHTNGTNGHCVNSHLIDSEIKI